MLLCLVISLDLTFYVLFRMAECNVDDARDQINSGLAQFQSAMKEMQTELEVQCLLITWRMIKKGVGCT